MAYIDIDVDEYMDNLNNREIKDVIKWLIDNEHIEDPVITKSTRGTSSQPFDEVIHKLIGNSHRFTLQEEEYIINLANRI
jgi:hypothetical protein